MTPCPGCGLVAPPEEGPTHAYIGASPGCWALYGELLARGVGPPASGQLVADTYALQHPGEPERRAIQSVCVHLISLCAAFERDWPAAKAPALIRSALAHADWFRWLDPVVPLGRITVADVLSADPADARSRRAREWAGDVWSAYEPHQPQARAWLERLLAEE